MSNTNDPRRNGNGRVHVSFDATMRAWGQVFRRTNTGRRAKLRKPQPGVLDPATIGLPLAGVGLLVAFVPLGLGFAALPSLVAIVLACLSFLVGPVRPSLSGLTILIGLVGLLFAWQMSGID